jgi:LCP family protein required for cell wall assembly
LFVSARAFAGRLVISLLIVSTLTVAGVAAVNRGIDDRVASIDRIKLELPPAPAEGANFLLLGSDTRAFVTGGSDEASGIGTADDTPGQRSDTLMVAHVEPSAQRTFIVSFPRDLLVTIPGLPGTHKINAAYENGGPQTVINMLKANFDVDINHYVEVDFRSFKAVVDAIGSVPVYFPFATRDDPDTQGGATSLLINAPGCYQFDGTTALDYVRARHLQRLDTATNRWISIDSEAPDIHRIERQQSFIRELAGIAIQRSLGDPFVALDVADKVLKFVQVDDAFGSSDVKALIRAFRTVDVNDQRSVEFETIPWKPNPADPLSSLVLRQPDADAMIARLRTFGDNTPPAPRVSPSQVKVKVIDTSGDGLAAAVSESLVKQGFVAAGTGSVRLPLVNTDIHYGPSQVEEAKFLLDYFPDARMYPDSAANDRVVIYLAAGFSEITVPSTTTTIAPATAEPRTNAAPASPTPTTTPPSTMALGSAC